MRFDVYNDSSLIMIA
jgi:hypothetical protein